MKLSPFPKSFKNIKELFDLITSKMGSDGGDFPRIIEIALSRNIFFPTDTTGIGRDVTPFMQMDEYLQLCLYVSRKLLPQETRYSIIEQGRITLIWTLKKFERYSGRKFVSQTDHRPVAHIERKKTIYVWVCRWVMLLQTFYYTAHFIKGTDNVIADFLSRSWWTE